MRLARWKHGAAACRRATRSAEPKTPLASRVERFNQLLGEISESGSCAHVALVRADVTSTVTLLVSGAQQVARDSNRVASVARRLRRAT